MISYKDELNMPELSIDKLNIELPKTLGARRHAIVQQLRAELKQLEWPSGELNELRLPPLALQTQQTNLAIARQIAKQIQHFSKAYLDHRMEYLR